jgi:hypothetical protein
MIDSRAARTYIQLKGLQTAVTVDTTSCLILDVQWLCTAETP